MAVAAPSSLPGSANPTKMTTASPMLTTPAIKRFEGDTREGLPAGELIGCTRPSTQSRPCRSWGSRRSHPIDRPRPPCIRPDAGRGYQRARYPLAMLVRAEPSFVRAPPPTAREQHLDRFAAPDRLHARLADGQRALPTAPIHDVGAPAGCPATSR